MNRFFVILAATLTLAAPVLAHDYMKGDIHIMNPWSRPLPPVSANGAAYMTLVNKGNTPDKLVSVSTPMATKAELHGHTMEGGIMKMSRVDAIEIAPGQSAVLKPGGLHVMMMGLTEALVEGKSYPLTLTFERAGTVEVTVGIFEPDESESSIKHDMKHEEKEEGG